MILSCIAMIKVDTGNNCSISYSPYPRNKYALIESFWSILSKLKLATTAARTYMDHVNYYAEA